MDKVVIDTNVIIAGLRSNAEASFWILRQIFAGKIQLVLSVSLALEYEDVLRRERTVTPFAANELEQFIDALFAAADFTEVFFHWRPQLRDAGDDHILELAVAANVNAIITHNIRDFAGSESFGMAILTPGDYALAQKGKR